MSDAGEALGRHDGLMYYTIGQRKGLGIGGHGDGRSWFVADKDLASNRLIVVQGEDHPKLYKGEALLDQITWVGGPPCKEGEPVNLQVKLRYRQADQKAKLVFHGEQGRLLFDNPQRAVTPGQSAVIYQGDFCLGGGIVL